MEVVTEVQERMVKKFIEVPLGTVVRDKDWRSFVRNYRRWRKQVLSRGGKGGLGNWHFRSATNQTQDMLNLVYQDQRWMQFWS
jgi:GTPase involved in cell partitioning and DNA repair